MRLTTTTFTVGILFLLLTWPHTSRAITNHAPHRLHAAANRTNPPRRGTQAKRAWIICQIFPRNKCHDAINVAYCESRLNPRAHNGQYQGIFQLGSSERIRYGHGRSAWKQTKAARAYHRHAGWQPWACKP